MKKKQYVLLLVIVAAVLACIVFILCLLQGHGHITKKQALADYDYMWKALEENYPYFGLCERKYSVDPQKIKETYRKRLDSAQTTGEDLLLDLFDIIDEAMGKFNMVGHLKAIDAGEFYLTQEDAASAQADQSDPNYPIFTDARAAAFYALLQQHENPSASYQDNGAPEYTIGSGDYVRSKFSVSEVDGIPIFKLSSFSCRNNADKEEYIRQLSAAVQQYINAPNLILDLRRNYGGSSHVWQNGLMPYLYCQGKTMLSSNRSGAYKNGALNRAFWGRDLTEDPTLETAEIGDMDFLRSKLSSLDGLMPEDLEGLDDLISVVQSQPCGYADTLFHGRLWILQDGGCASSAELLLQWAKETGIATLVGQQSAGISSAIIPPVFTYLLLPNSGIVIKFTPFYAFDENGGPYEINGTAPDISCSSADALNVCLQAIKSE